jgi:hypothetical protein
MGMPSPGGDPPLPPAQTAPGVTRPMGGGGNPQMDAINMTLGQAAYGPQERGLDRQMKIADELRGDKMPGLREGARVTTAANPLEFAATALNRVGGKLMGDRLQGQQGEMFDRRMGRLREDMDASRRLAAGYGSGEL